MPTLNMLLEQMGDDEPEPRRPDMRAQRMELLSRFADYNKPTRWRPKTGEFVRFKAGMSAFREGRQIATIFWCYLVLSEPGDLAIVRSYIAKTGNFEVFDCLLAYVSDNAHCLVFVPADTHALEPDPDETAA